MLLMPLLFYAVISVVVAEITVPCLPLRHFVT